VMFRGSAVRALVRIGGPRPPGSPPRSPGSPVGTRAFRTPGTSHSPLGARKDGFQEQRVGGPQLRYQHAVSDAEIPSDLPVWRQYVARTSKFFDGMYGMVGLLFSNHIALNSQTGTPPSTAAAVAVGDVRAAEGGVVGTSGVSGVSSSAEALMMETSVSEDQFIDDCVWNAYYSHVLANPDDARPFTLQAVRALIIKMPRQIPVQHHLLTTYNINNIFNTDFLQR